jgi:hypothetical protein
MENREAELLRQRVTFLEEALQQCLERMRALEARVAMLEARPVAAMPTPELVGQVAERVADQMTGEALSGYRKVRGKGVALFEPAEETKLWQHVRKKEERVPR